MFKDSSGSRCDLLLIRLGHQSDIIADDSRNAIIRKKTNANKPWRTDEINNGLENAIAQQNESFILWLDSTDKKIILFS